MIYPTADEIRAAHDDIDRDGPMANTTMALAAIVLKDPCLRAIIERLAPVSAVGEATIMACISALSEQDGVVAPDSLLEAAAACQSVGDAIELYRTCAELRASGVRCGHCGARIDDPAAHVCEARA